MEQIDTPLPKRLVEQPATRSRSLRAAYGTGGTGDETSTSSKKTELDDGTLRRNRAGGRRRDHRGRGIRLRAYLRQSDEHDLEDLEEETLDQEVLAGADSARWCATPI